MAASKSKLDEVTEGASAGSDSQWIPVDVYFAQAGVPRIGGAGVVALSAERDKSEWCSETGEVAFTRGGHSFVFSLRAIPCFVCPVKVA